MEGEMGVCWVPGRGDFLLEMGTVGWFSESMEWINRGKAQQILEKERS